jgi:lysine 2,3-aminomutase
MNAPGDRTLRSIDALIEAGLAAAEDRHALGAVAAEFAVAITPAVAGLIERTNAHDPIAAQYLPDVRELTTLEEELHDPIGDDAHRPVKGLVHRYPDRVLLKLSAACAVYCRFCFRREMIGPGSDALSGEELAAALAYIESTPSVWEVILTGGDPLVLSPRRLGAILEKLRAIGHVAVVRIHTRVPVADPARITPALIAALRTFPSLWLAVHANHAREFTAEAQAALAALTDAGVPLLGQSVLLRGINDEAATLESLFRTMVKLRIKPYYLHHPDLARGTSHFRVSLAEGQALMKSLRGRLSGAALPSYVLDIPGGYGKVPVGPSYVQRTTDATYRVEDPNGGLHAYPPHTAISKRP